MKSRGNEMEPRLIVHIYLFKISEKKRNTRKSRIHIWRWRVRKYANSAIGVEKTFEASDTELERRQSLENGFSFPCQGKDEQNNCCEINSSRSRPPLKL